MVYLAFSVAFDFFAVAVRTADEESFCTSHIGKLRRFPDFFAHFFRLLTQKPRYAYTATLLGHDQATFVQPFMAVVADITYIHTLEGFAYAAILTDVASRMVVGF